jgi:hypothetical protein
MIIRCASCYETYQKNGFYYIYIIIISWRLFQIKILFAVRLEHWVKMKLEDDLFFSQVQELFSGFIINIMLWVCSKNYMTCAVLTPVGRIFAKLHAQLKCRSMKPRKERWCNSLTPLHAYPALAMEVVEWSAEHLIQSRTLVSSNLCSKLGANQRRCGSTNVQKFTVNVRNWIPAIQHLNESLITQPVSGVRQLSPVTSCVMEM